MVIWDPGTQKSEQVSSNEHFEKLAQELGCQTVFEKEAFLGLGAKALSWGAKALSGAQKGGRLAGWGKKLTQGSEKLTRGSKMFQGGGKYQWANPKRVIQRGIQAGTKGLSKIDPRLGKGFSSAMRGTARQAHGFGLFGGGLGALMAEEGERTSGFLKGYGAGALGGLGWGAGRNIARSGVTKLLKKTMSPTGFSKVMKNIAPSSGKFKYKGKDLGLGGGAKAWGQRVGMGTAGTLGALGGASLLEGSDSLGGSDAMSSDNYANLSPSQGGGQQFYSPQRYQGGQNINRGGGGYYR